MSLLDKLKLYDGHMVSHFSRQDVREMQRHHPTEGMSGISPRVRDEPHRGRGQRAERPLHHPLRRAGQPVEGLDENVSYEADVATRIALITDTVKAYDDLAVRAVQVASEEAFEDKPRICSPATWPTSTRTWRISPGTATSPAEPTPKGSATCGARARPRDYRPQQGGVPG